ncbi:MAG: hypothetical protein ACPG4Q_04010, partial [Phycisphaeraceae bacterium]
SVPVTGIAEGEVIFFHLFDKQWGDLVPSNLVVSNGQVSIEIPSVSGDRILQLQYGQVYKANKSVSVQASATTDAGTPTDDGTTTDAGTPTDDGATTDAGTPTNDDTATSPDVPSVDAPHLLPGNGFVGETPQPGAIGSKTTKAIARWDVVPEQRFDGVFQVGVIAFHSYGMDRVELSFNGGPWQVVTEPTLNPRTNLEEYWAKIDANDVEDGRVELRAVAYPKEGTPRVLETLVLFANAGGSVKFPVLELGAGYNKVPDSLPVPEEGWFIVRPKPGVSKEECVVLRIGRHRKGNIKIEGVTIKAGPGGRGAGNWGKLWMDDVDYIGVNADTTDGDLTWWISDHQWAAKYHTDMTIRRVQAAFHACDNGIIRNIVMDEIYEDAFRQSGLIANVTIENLSPAKSSFHPDAFQWHNRTPTNMIVYNFLAKRVVGQGLFPGNLKDCAFVNVDITTVGQYRPLQMQGEARNVLIQDSNMTGEIGGILRYDKGFKAYDMVFRDSMIGPDFPYLPLGWENDEIKIYPWVTYD